MRAVAVLGVGVALGLVVGGDVGVGDLEGGPHVGRDRPRRALATSAGGTRRSSTSAPSKRAVSSRRATSPRARTSASSARTSSMGGSTWAAGRGRRPRRSPSTPRRSSRCSTGQDTCGPEEARNPFRTRHTGRWPRTPPSTPPSSRRCPPRSTTSPSASPSWPTSTRDPRGRTWPPTSTRSSATWSPPAAAQGAARSRLTSRADGAHWGSSGRASRGVGR